jgi:hypothetical protein
MGPGRAAPLRREKRIMATNFEGWILQEIEWFDKAALAKAVLAAINMRKGNNCRTPEAEIHSWLRRVGRDQMLAAGDPLPGPGPFVLCRGVAGVGRQRRPRGVSWTDSIDTARWFANRFPRLEDPAILTMTIDAEHIYAYDSGRNEREFIVSVPPDVKPSRLIITWPGQPEKPR